MWTVLRGSWLCTETVLMGLEAGKVTLLVLTRDIVPRVQNISQISEQPSNNNQELDRKNQGGGLAKN